MGEYQEFKIKLFLAKYLLIGQTYSILRTWKKKRGLLFSRQVLNLDAQWISQLKNTHAQAIVPIPQSFRRSWKVGGSSALTLSHWIGKNTKIPIALLLKSTLCEQKRQAELSSQERMKNQIPIQWDASIQEHPFKKIILVDDFMTTGHTLRWAAQILAQNQVEEIYVFLLGVRPTKQET